MTPHCTVALYGIADGCLTIGGVPIDRLADRVGSTPFFAYDRALLTRRVADLRAALPAGVELSYAIKANPMPAVVQHMSRLVDGLDVASAIELRTALDTQTPPCRVSFAGPGKRPSELSQAIAAGVTLELESENEAERVIDIAERMGIQASVAIRVNPDFQVKGSGMRLGGGPQQFGIDAEQVGGVLKQLAASGAIDVIGFHVFPGSQNLSAEILCDAQRKTVELVLRLSCDSELDLRYLNLGGGFGIPYFERDRPLDIVSIGQHLDGLLSDRLRPAFPDARVVIELGRYLVGEAGVYVTRIIDRKQSRGETFLIVDGGLHHQLAASGNFGQVIRRNYPVVIGNRIDEAKRDPVNVVGCLCTPLDLLSKATHLPDAQIGDLVVVFEAGAYGRTASPTAFLSHPEPIEVLL